jgi:hypothetical protein
VKNLRLSRACAEWLVHDSGLTFLPVSPFSSLRAAGPRAGPAERAAAAQAELAGQGVQFGAVESGAPGIPFREALELLARPEARIQVVTQTAGKPPIKMTLFARAGHACAFVPEPEAFQIGPCRSLDATFAALQDQVRPPRVLEGQQILFWPSVLGVLVMLWPGAGLDLDQPLSPDEALRRLGLPAASADDGEAMLGELAEKGLLAREAGALSVPASYRPWLQAALSGHMLQLEYASLLGAETLEKMDGRTTRLLFVGPSGARLLSRTLAGEALAQVLNGQPAAESQAIHLSALAPARLADLLRVHLGLARMG